MEVKIEECCRYMGVRGPADERTKALAASCIEELNTIVTPRHVMREFPLTVEDDLVDLGCFRTKSRNLAKNLRDCERILLFAATLGEGADLLIRRYSRTEVSRGLAMQASSAAMIEAYCDELCGKWAVLYGREGYRPRPRFSPGYGDFSLTEQIRICDVLKTGKTIGVTLTDSLLMMPSKSVTAVVGLTKSCAGPEGGDCDSCTGPEGGDCGSCTLADCAFRKN